jgi:Tfp pilus assembly protein PilX
MKTSKSQAAVVAPPAPVEGRQRGAIMMFVLLVMLLIAAITLTVMNLIAADQAAGVRELQAVQVFNVAEAGVQYAIGQLQISGAATYGYPQQTLTITSGSTTLGTATIRVNCVTDTSWPPTTWPCTGTYAAYRRIISTGSLTIGGPSRTVVAVVQGYGLAGSSYALCAYSTLTATTGATIYGDVGSNGSITLQSSATVNGNAGASPPYTGLARANGTITCATSCAAQVAGGATANVSGTVCPTLTTGPYSPGGGTQIVPGGSTWTMNSGTGYNWNTITLNPGKCNSGSKGLTTLQIDATAGNVVVNVNTLMMNDCSRLMILGAGNVDLRIGAATGTGLSVGNESHFGVLPTDTWGLAAPVTASQLEVEVNSSSTCATNCAVDIQSIDTIGVAAGVFLVPNGEMRVGSFEQMSGAIVANTVTLNSSSTFTYDTTAGTAATTVSVFNTLRSWKDQ